MAFIKYKGKSVTRWMPVTPSTTFTKGDIVAFSSGKLIKATTTSAAKSHEGVIKITIAATDSNYASDRLVPVEVPVNIKVQWRCTGVALVATENGLWMDLASAGTVDRAGSTYDAVKQVGILSATEGIFLLNLGGAVETIS